MSLSHSLAHNLHTLPSQDRINALIKPVSERLASAVFQPFTGAQQETSGEIVHCCFLEKVQEDLKKKKAHPGLTWSHRDWELMGRQLTTRWNLKRLPQCKHASYLSCQPLVNVILKIKVKCSLVKKKSELTSQNTSRMRSPCKLSLRQKDGDAVNNRSEHGHKHFHRNIKKRLTFQLSNNMIIVGL